MYKGAKEVTLIIVYFIFCCARSYSSIFNNSRPFFTYLFCLVSFTLKKSGYKQCEHEMILDDAPVTPTIL